MRDTIKISYVEYIELKLCYEEALEQEKEQFEWRGIPLLTQFAKYLLEHIDNQFNS
jgi:hypothetical protein